MLRVGLVLFFLFCFKVYPISLNPQSTIFVTAFAQGGNAWGSVKDYNPFDMKRSVGMGLRVFLPMFGLLGLDYGVGFDRYDNRPGGTTGLKNIAKFTLLLQGQRDLVTVAKMTLSELAFT